MVKNIVKTNVRPACLSSCCDRHRPLANGISRGVKQRKQSPFHLLIRLVDNAVVARQYVILLIGNRSIAIKKHRTSLLPFSNNDSPLWFPSFYPRWVGATDFNLQRESLLFLFLNYFNLIECTLIDRVLSLFGLERWKKKVKFSRSFKTIALSIWLYERANGWQQQQQQQQQTYREDRIQR